VDGAAVHDPARGVTYRVTIGQGEGRVWLRTLEVVPDDPAEPGVSNAVLRRVPAVALAEFVALFHDRRARLRDAAGGTDPDDPDALDALQQHGRTLARAATTPGGLAPARGDVPTSAELAALLREGMTRQRLAERFHRSPSTISDWIGRAYREVPDQMPPRRRGRRPKDSGDLYAGDVPRYAGDDPTAGETGHQRRSERMREREAADAAARDQAVREAVAAAPPLTDAQAQLIAGILSRDSEGDR